MADVTEIDTMKHFHGGFEKIDKEMSRYPHCIVWTPIPVLTWVETGDVLTGHVRNTNTFWQ